MRNLWYCLLALFLAVASISAAAHGVVHVDNVPGQCLLCASHAGSSPAAAAPACAAALTAFRRPAPPPPRPASVPRISRPALHARAPPASS